MPKKIRVAIFGVGNCAKSLVQGVAYYSQTEDKYGLAFETIGGYRATDIEFVLAYDVDSRKVGKPLADAISMKPNCAMNIIGFRPASECGLTRVEMGNILDGVAHHMYSTICVETHLKEADKKEVSNKLMDRAVDVALLYLPVGSQEATEFYVECCLAAHVPFINCIPVFIVSNPDWEGRIRDAKICAIGDDMRSQVGASVLSQVLQEMFLDRGAKVKFHCQTNQGGNTDFLNMTDKDRLVSKKKSKENVITSQNDIRGIEPQDTFVYAGPSDYISYLGDNKVAHIRIEADGFGGAPITLDCRLSVQDSPNSAGIVIDAIRFLHVAQRRSMYGPLIGASAFTQKSPPVQLTYAEAFAACKQLATG